jgi:hypothetical protein
MTAEKNLWIEMSIREISTQAHFAEISYSHIDPKAEAGTDLVFSSIHSFLSHCAMVSKMLAAKDEDDPAMSIGHILGISNTSLIHERQFRNNLEHYDERLKGWIRQHGVNSIIGTYNIGPRKMIQVPNMVFVSHYDPYTKMFTFVNEDFDLGALFNEVSRIKCLTDEWVERNVLRVT